MCIEKATVKIIIDNNLNSLFFMAKIIIGIAGGIASGKSLAGKVANGLGFHAIETSDVIRSLLREEGE